LGYVAIEQDGKINVHAEGIVSNYATLCGMDGDDSKVGQRAAPLDIGARIDCPHCIALIREAKTYREKDFDPDMRTEPRRRIRR
jgi:hypothetical protein